MTVSVFIAEMQATSVKDLLLLLIKKNDCHGQNCKQYVTEKTFCDIVIFHNHQEQEICLNVSLDG